MNSLKSILILCIAVIGSMSLSAQDIHFSQFYLSPLNLNPAMTGVMNGTTRVTLNYRNQWAPVIGSAAYQTYSLSYDQKKAVGAADFFGFGGALWSDVAGDSRFGSTQLKGAGSYSKKLFGGRKQGHYLTIGTDLGITQRRIRKGDLRWLTQVNPETAEFCAGCGQPENLPNNNLWFVDVTVGGMWYSQLEDRTNFFIGGAVHHLNQPTVSFNGGDASGDKLYLRRTIHAGGEAPINKIMSVRPNIIYMSQGPHREINAGASLRYKTKSGSGFYSSNYFVEAGAWYRVGTNVDGGISSDAIILTGRLDMDKYSVGISYDYTLSSLSQSSPGNGSFELSMIYLINNGLQRGVQCPVF